MEVSADQFWYHDERVQARLACEEGASGRFQTGPAVWARARRWVMSGARCERRATTMGAVLECWSHGWLLDRRPWGRRLARVFLRLEIERRDSSGGCTVDIKSSRGMRILGGCRVPNYIHYTDTEYSGSILQHHSLPATCSLTSHHPVHPHPPNNCPAGQLSLVSGSAIILLLGRFRVGPLCRSLPQGPHHSQTAAGPQSGGHPALGASTAARVERESHARFTVCARLPLAGASNGRIRECDLRSRPPGRAVVLHHPHRNDRPVPQPRVRSPS